MMNKPQNAGTMQCGIMVAGGSLEGCVAAVTAARAGRQVILIEKHGSLGGMASNGLAGWMEPSNENSNAARIRSEILKRLDCKDNADGALYPDQRMKIVLGEMLGEAGVLWLDHVFVSRPVVEDQSLKGFQITGKTGVITIYCNQVIDATDTLETAGMLGLKTTSTGDKVSVTVKMNGLREDAISICKHPAGGKIGTLKAPLQTTYNGLNVYCDELRVLLRDNTGEALLSGLYCDLPEFSPLTLSAAQIELRRFAYDLRDSMRATVEGMEHVNIIHVAPQIDAYGLRQCENPYSNLTLLNNDGEAYTNGRALEKGTGAYTDG